MTAGTRPKPYDFTRWRINAERDEDEKTWRLTLSWPDIDEIEDHPLDTDPARAGSMTTRDYVRWQHRARTIAALAYTAMSVTYTHDPSGLEPDMCGVSVDGLFGAPSVELCGPDRKTTRDCLAGVVEDVQDWVDDREDPDVPLLADWITQRQDEVEEFRRELSRAQQRRDRIARLAGGNPDVLAYLRRRCPLDCDEADAWLDDFDAQCKAYWATVAASTAGTHQATPGLLEQLFTEAEDDAHACQVCGFAMADPEPGQTTHPACETSA